MVGARSVIVWLDICWESELFLRSFSQKVSCDLVYVIFHFSELFINALQLICCFKYFKLHFIRCISIIFLLFIVLLIWVYHIFVWAFVLLWITLLFLVLDGGWERGFMRSRYSRYACKSWSILTRNMHMRILLRFCWVKLVSYYSWTWMIKLWRHVSMLLNFQLDWSGSSSISEFRSNIFIRTVDRIYSSVLLWLKGCCVCSLMFKKLKFLSKSFLLFSCFSVSEFIFFILIFKFVKIVPKFLVFSVCFIISVNERF